jgi:site-specific recombinase XerD
VKVATLIEKFMQHCREHRRPNTIRSYAGRLKALGEQLGERELASITYDDLEAFLRSVNHRKDGSPKANDTRRANIATVQTIFRYAKQRKLIAELPFEKLEKPRGRRRERIPTEEEIQAVERHASPAFLLAYRALRQTGARPGELAAAQVEQYDRARRLIVLREHKTAGATGRPRKIGVGAKLAAILAAAIGERSTGAIFLAENGKPWTSQKLSKTYKALARRAGLPEDLVLYLTRHAHATELCLKAGIHAAAKALGHSSLNTTMRYVHEDDDVLGKNQDLI